MAGGIDPGLEPLFEAAGQQYDIDPRLLRAVALTESSGDPRTPDSKTGAKGLMQFMPDTAAEMGVRDPYDPAQAIPGAARYLARGLAEGERLKVADPVQYALRYYNGGGGGPGNPATHTYVDAVARHYNALAGGDAPANPAVLAGMPAGADFAAGRPPPEMVGSSSGFVPPGGSRPWPFDLPVKMSADAPSQIAPMAGRGGVPRMPLSLPMIPSQGQLPSPDDPAFPMGTALPPELRMLADAQLAAMRPEDVPDIVGRPDLTQADRVALDRRLGAMQGNAAPATATGPGGLAGLPPGLAQLAQAGGPGGGIGGANGASPMMLLSDAGAAGDGGLVPGGGAALKAPPQAPLALPADLEALRNVDMSGGGAAGPPGGPPGGPSPVTPPMPGRPGAPPQAAAATGAPGVSDEGLSVADQAKLADFLYQGNYKVGPAPAGPGRSDGGDGRAAPLPAADPNALPPLPPGVYPVIKPVELQQNIYKHSIAGFNDAAGQMQKDMDRVHGGEMLYSDGVWRPYPGGPKDPQVIARQAAAASGGEAAGRLPYDLTEITIQTPQGQRRVFVRKSDALANAPAVAPAGAGGTPGGAAGAGTVNAAGGALGATPAIGTQVGTPVMTPEQEATSKAYGEQAGQIIEAANKAPDILGRVQILRNAADQFSEGAFGGLGPSAQRRLDMANRLVDLANQFGVTVSPALKQTVEAGQIIGKEQGMLTAELVRQLGSREAAQIYSATQSYTPGVTMSQGGYNAIVNSIEQGARRDTDKAAFQDEWLGTHPSIAGMQTAFNKAHPIETYASQVVPIPVAQAQGKFVPGAVYLSKSGRRGVALTPDGQMQTE